MLSNVPVGHRKFVLTLLVAGGVVVLGWFGFPIIFWIFAIRFHVDPEASLNLIREIRQVILWGGAACIGVFSGANLVEWYIRRPSKEAP